jgi:hypothetical protein
VAKSPAPEKIQWLLQMFSTVVRLSILQVLVSLLGHDYMVLL